jgi:hypothetical protein
MTGVAPSQERAGHDQAETLRFRRRRNEYAPRRHQLMNADIVCGIEAEAFERANVAHRAAHEHAGLAVHHACTAGAALLEAKEACAPGMGLQSLAQHCADIGERQAQNYMKLARHVRGDPDSLSELATLALRDVLTMLASPNPKRNAVSAEPTLADEMGDAAAPEPKRSIGRATTRPEEVGSRPSRMIKFDVPRLILLEDAGRSTYESHREMITRDILTADDAREYAKALQATVKAIERLRTHLLKIAQHKRAAK